MSGFLLNGTRKARVAELVTGYGTRSPAGDAEGMNEPVHPKEEVRDTAPIAGRSRAGAWLDHSPRDGAHDAPCGNTMSTAMRKNWPVFAIFLLSLLLPVVYVIAAVARWVDWASWLPVVVSLGFVGYGAAIRINRLAQRELSPTK